MSALLLALHTILRNKVTHTSLFFSLFFLVRTFHMYVCMYVCMCITSLVHDGIKCRRAILWPPQLRTLAG